jgi:hypothetical protein
MKAFTLAAPFLALSLVASSERAARAEAPHEGDPGAAEHGVDLAPTLGMGAIKGSKVLHGQFDTAFSSYDDYVVLQAAAAYRLTPRLSVGALASYWMNPDQGRVWQVAGEARYHVVQARFIDLWGAGEVGIAAAVAGGPDCGDCGAPNASNYATRFAPLAGVGTGIDFLPVRYVSLGLEGRALVTWFDDAQPPEASTPRTIAPGFFFGLTLGAHVPL